MFPALNLPRVHTTKANPEKIARGEQNGGAVLTEDAVRIIRHQLAGGMSHRAIAKLHGVSKAGIGLIAQGKTWKHVL